MLNIIKADLFRIFKSKGIYIVIAILLITAFMSACTLEPISMGLNLGEENNAEIYGLSNEQMQTLYNTSSIKDTQTLLKKYGNYSLDTMNIAKNNNLYYIFIAIVIFVIGCDFSSQTLKNTISTNISKTKYYFSKLILSLSLSTLLVIIYATFCHITNIILNGYTFASPFSNSLILIIKQLPLLYAIISILVTLNVITRKTSVYNGIAIPLIIVFQIAFMSLINFLDLPKTLIDYEWETALTKLCLSTDNTYIFQTLSLWTVIFFISVFAGYQAFKTKDI